jgi:hypothetical protein
MIHLSVPDVQSDQPFLETRDITVGVDDTLGAVVVEIGAWQLLFAPLQAIELAITLAGCAMLARAAQREDE